MDQWQPENGMALASMIAGIVSVAASCCCSGGLIASSLAVIFACLSRGDGGFSGRAKIGLGAGIAGMFLGAAAVLIWIAVLGRFGSGVEYFYSVGPYY